MYQKGSANGQQYVLKRCHHCTRGDARGPGLPPLYAF